MHNNYKSQDYFLRLKDIIGDRAANPPIPALIPISKSTWWIWVARGFAPQPKRIGRITMWQASEVEAFIQQLASQPAVCLNKSLSEPAAVVCHR